jgi:pantoate--beta-alanine ligase
MKILKTVSELKLEIEQVNAMGLSIGFVPTMGALHEGHFALIRQAREENEITVASIFVNPTQFNDKDDFEKYPNTLNSDVELLTEEKVNLLFLPNYNELYPDNYRYKVTENSFSNELCGASRPGHFDGVLTVVMKLLNLVEADRAYFGEKDFQQLELVKSMTEAFFMKTKVVPCPTVREADGLAMSSRNRRLSSTEREMAPFFSKLLREPLNNEETKRMLEEAGFKVDYVEERLGRKFGAVFLGDVRLIDNVEVRDANSGAV